MGQIRVFAKGFKGGSKPVFIEEDATVTDFIKELGEVLRLNPGDLRVLYESHNLDSATNGHKTLKSLHIKDNSTVFVVAQMKGGMFRLSREVSRIVKTTTEADVITFDDDEGTPRYKMPCGHAIGTDSLKEHSKYELKKGRSEIRCPSCHSQWQNFIVREVSNLTKAETKEFDTDITKNNWMKGPEIKQCPECETYCIRQNKSNSRVVCSVCSNGSNMYEFCWWCLQKWRTGGTSDCGNAGCLGAATVLEFLKKCPKKEIVGVTGCPSIRACPKCCFLIEHESGCKQMTCRNCTCEFCFICLKVKANGRYKCGAYNDKCSIAPFQSNILK